MSVAEGGDMCQVAESTPEGEVENKIAQRGKMISETVHQDFQPTMMSMISEIIGDMTQTFKKITTLIGDRNKTQTFINKQFRWPKSFI